MRYRVRTQYLDGFKPARVWQASPIKNVQNKILGSVQVLVISDDEREKFLKRLFIRRLEHRSQLTERSEASMMKKKLERSSMRRGGDSPQYAKLFLS